MDNCLEGAYSDAPNDEYHDVGAASNSRLTAISRSPAHYKHATQKLTAAMNMGTALHAAILEPERFAREYVLLDAKNRRTKAYKAIKDSGIEDGKIFVENESKKLLGMEKAIYENPHAAKILNAGGVSELSFFTKSPLGVLVKCRFDFLSMSDGGYYAVDIKKTQDASLKAFSRTIHNYRYHVQAAFYKNIFKLATGKECRFIFLAVEEQSPYFNKLWEVNDESILLGKLQYEKDLQVYSTCLETGCYPLPNGALEIIGLPFWVLYEADTLFEVRHNEQHWRY